MAYALIALALATLADIATTIAALKRPGFREGNPIIRKLMDNIGIGWIFVKVAGTALIAWVLASAGLIWGVWVCAAVVAVIAAHNYRMIRK